MPGPFNNKHGTTPFQMPEADNDDTQPTGGRCPICKQPAVQKFRPFCSGRCADVDLGRWMSGRYAVPAGDADEDEDGDIARAEGLLSGGETPRSRDE